MNKKRDWTAAKIKYEIAKRGLTLYAVSQAAGLNKRACSQAIAEPHSRGEFAIGKALDVAPCIIWPSRYHDDGSRLDPQPNFNYRERNKKSNINQKSKIRHLEIEVKHAS